MHIYSFRRFLISQIFLLLSPCILYAQMGAQWRVHDLNRPQPPIVTPPTQFLPITAPSDAVVLFSGQDDITKWVGMNGQPTKWVCKEDYFECVKGSGYIKTKQSFGDVQLHVEWMAPTPATGQSQGRGNSGVFLMGRYEVQVLDSYNNITYPDGQAAAVYGQYPPAVNAARPAGEWQAYDIVFHRPRFNNLGQLTKKARMTVFHNGVLVQDNVTLWGETDWKKYRVYKNHPDKLPLSLQDHGNPVRYRNIWIRELEEIPLNPASAITPKVTLSTEALQKYVGTYKKEEKGEHQIFIEDDTLWILAHGSRRFELIPQSNELFSARFTAIEVKFIFGENGIPAALDYTFTGYTHRATRSD
ncbi:MAG: DUF1080 domain-containing protein [Calditrichaeota bacterium]|nr:MAG: DUF1080 domain-containing protein [Calditrichota bacterium]